MLFANLQTDDACRYDSNATTLLQVCLCNTSQPQTPPISHYLSSILHASAMQMHVCMEMANIFEAQGKIDDASMHRVSAIRHLQTSVLGADCMFVASTHAKNGHMLHKVCARSSFVVLALNHETAGWQARRGTIILRDVPSHKARKGNLDLLPQLALRLRPSVAVRQCSCAAAW